MKKKTTALALAVMMLAALAAPIPASAAGQGYAVIEQVIYPAKGEGFGEVIPMGGGSYAVTYSQAGKSSLRKYDAAGNLVFNTPLEQYVSTDTHGKTIVQAADGGIYIASGQKLQRLDAAGALTWTKTYGDYSIQAIEPYGAGIVALAYHTGQKKVHMVSVDAAGQMGAGKTLADYGIKDAAAMTPISLASFPDGSLLILSAMQANDLYSTYGITKLAADGKLSFNSTVEIKYGIESMLALNDGRVLCVGSSGLTLLDNKGAKQWDSPSISGYMTSAVQTDEGFMAVGHQIIHKVMPREDMALYHDAMIVRFDKNGKIIEYKLFYENMESLGSIADLGNGKYMAVGSVLEMVGPTGHYSALMRIGINTDPNFKPKSGWERSDGKWYYYKSGNKVRGWQKVGNHWYFMGGDAAMRTGWIQEDRDTWYHLKSNGAMSTGWQKVGNSWYYLLSSGKMSRGWQKVNGLWYYMKDSGAMSTGWQKLGSTWYYLQPSGAMKTGWLQDGGAWYYLSPSGAMVTGKYSVYGKVHNFAASGRWLG